MLGHVISASLEAGLSRLCLVTAPDQNNVRDYALTEASEISNCIQENQLGTGDAVRAAILRKTEAPLIVPGQSGAEPGLIGAAWLGLERLGSAHA